MQGVERMWSPGSLPGDLESHPGRPLKDHLMGTWKLAECLSERNRVPIDMEKLKWVCWTHDLGKAHCSFQKYLQGKGTKVRHAEPSAWFTLAVTNDLVCSEGVRRHHSSICNYDESKSYWACDDFKAENVNVSLKEILPSWPFMLSEHKLQELAFELLLGEKNRLEDWLRFRTIYSLFITSDRMDAMRIQKVEKSVIPQWKAKTFSVDTPMAGWRSEVRRLCVEAADNVSLPGIYSLSLPTGSGKTLIGLEMAHNWAKKMKFSNIIYALPFISIVEQNAQVASEVFGEDNVQEDHSLAYISDTETENTTPEKRMQSFFRYWDSPVVVTTLVQLWTAIFGSSANESMNFHRLSNSVVIMDEPQAIRPQLWKGFGKVLGFLSKKFNTTFLLMTATKPHIVEGKELAPAGVVAKRPYKTRQECRFIDGVHDIDSLPDLLEENISRLRESSGLVVLNTKRSALKAYDMLKGILGQNDSDPILFLSGWMTPKHRKEVLGKLIGLEKEGVKRYLVSTQVVEAGVDLDFQWVFRDLGPLDSIIQVAGRCNRHFSMGEPGEVVIAELMDPEKGKSFSRDVYDDVLLLASREILGKRPLFDEQDTVEMVDEYFSRILDGLKPEHIWEDIERGSWDTLPKLIEKRTKGVSLYVELDENLRNLLDELSNMTRGFENLDKARNIARKLQMYKIEVPAKSIEKWEQKLGSNFIIDGAHPVLCKLPGRDEWFLSKEGIGTVYSMETGFIPPDGDSGDEFL
ncbi:MAG: CRISPR-associated helicase, Cas3 family [Thermovirga lienii]|nr:MAG: CRISPR-associated helicase, Cas3 family [Thermovirga lienii]